MANNIKAQIRDSWGENRRIDGPYDLSAAARCRNGIFVGIRKDGVKIFRGIPFACPPTGERRWKKPLPPADSDCVYEAKYNGRTPIQTEWFSERASYYPQGEDCLYLNVWTGEEPAAGKTVMVFIHGGSYGWGGTADPLYDGFHFAIRSRTLAEGLVDQMEDFIRKHAKSDLAVEAIIQLGDQEFWQDIPEYRCFPACYLKLYFPAAYKSPLQRFHVPR